MTSLMTKFQKIRNVIKHKLHVDDNKLNFIFDSALEMTEGNVEIYSLTKDIRDNFDKDEILEIFEYMWSVMLADGEIDDYESALMSKLVGLFHLTGKESAEAKKRLCLIIKKFFFFNRFLDSEKIFLCFIDLLATLFLHNLKLEGFKLFLINLITSSSVLPVFS